jgi:hypothetical protein
MKNTLLIPIIFIFSFNAYSQWVQMLSSLSGFIRNIIEVNGTLYISHNTNGVYKSTDGALTWQQINNGLKNTQSKQVFEITYFKGDLFAATVDGIYKSTNDGAEWIKKSNGITIGPDALNEFCESAFEYNGVLYTGAWNGIYCSTDEAENWFVTNATGKGINAKNFSDHNGILFAARDSINFPDGYKSTDSGVSWQALTSMNFPTISFYRNFQNYGQVQSMASGFRQIMETLGNNAAQV